jgi:rare lipoprotein A (peptidoglycan hydrolase)
MDKRTANYGQSSYMMIFDRGPYGAGRILDAMPYPLRDLAGKRVGGLKVKIEVAYTRYQCSGYKCLPKKLKSNRVTGEMLLKLIMKASNGKLNPRND